MDTSEIDGVTLCMRLAWITDPHLNFLPPMGSVKFGEWVRKTSEADAVVITGDIAEYPSLMSLLSFFTAGCQRPVYFVLGNHDLYRGSFESVKQAAYILHESVPNLHWLDVAGVVELTPDTALVGNGGWYDARSGDPFGSNVTLSDFVVIEDFKGKGRVEIIEKCREIASQMVKEAKPVLHAAAARYKHVIFATHVPPFRESTFHEGKISDKNWLPWFSNLSFGQMLSEAADLFPSTDFKVLCGHTHSPGEYQHSANLSVTTGKSQYYNPSITKVLDLRPTLTQIESTPPL